VIAPPSSGKIYEVLSSSEEERNGLVSYSFEYTVKKANYYQHCVSVIINKDTDLYTLTSMAPVKKWEKVGKNIQRIAKSFVIL
jgi:hypothetical protein